MSRVALAFKLACELVGALALGVALVFATRILVDTFRPELRAASALLIFFIAAMAFAWLVDTVELAIKRRAHRRNGGL